MLPPSLGAKPRLRDCTKPGGTQFAFSTGVSHGHNCSPLRPVFTRSHLRSPRFRLMLRNMRFGRAIAGGALLSLLVVAACRSTQPMPSPVASGSGLAEPDPRLDLPTVSLTVDPSLYLAFYTGGEWAQLSSLPPGHFSSASCLSGSPDAVLLDVFAAAPPTFVTPTEWPTDLAGPRSCDRAPASKASLYQAAWSIGDQPYWAEAAIGPEASATSRQAVFDSFASLEFPGPGYQPLPLPSVYERALLLWVDGGEDGPDGPWTLTVLETLRYTTSDQEVALDVWTKPVDGFGRVSAEPGLPIIGLVDRSAIEVRFTPETGPEVQGTVYRVPLDSGWSPHMSRGQVAFLIPVTGPVRGTLVATDSQGNEAGRHRVG
jgi:hypothetical protein